MKTKTKKENNTMAKKNDKKQFKWNVWLWDFNHDDLEEYDVVPRFEMELERLKKNEKPKTKEEFSEFLRGEAQYHFWAKCEYEMIIHGWPAQKNDKKVDAYDQLMMNWDNFIEAYWNAVGSRYTNADHRKQRGRTAPNKSLKKYK